MLYNPTDQNSIEDYAKQLLNKSLVDLVPTVSKEVRKGKGGFGQKVEKFYFGYEPNSSSEPDFPDAGVELKTAPLKKTVNGLKSKERIVLNIIDYMKEHQATFEQSSFWKKNKLILMMFFLHKVDIPDINYIFKYIFLWNYPEKDLKIIQSDWNTIVDKIKMGKAHELSEGDTLYLGACTKGARGGSNSTLRKQPFSEKGAPQRAFSLKQGYVNAIITQYTNSIDYEPAVTSDELKNKPFETLITEKFEEFYGKSLEEIGQSLGIEVGKSKDKIAIICRRVLGISQGRKIEEFDKADIQMKTIAINRNGTPIEEMSFKQIDFIGILSEDWENCYWHEALTKKFFFVVFEEFENQAYLKKVFFWTMPYEDLLLAKNFWEDTQKKIKNNDFENFIKSSAGGPCFVRTKGRDSKDVMITANGNNQKKLGYWLSRKYIKNVIAKG
jgi:DNA mismatch repair protein MutH